MDIAIIAGRDFTEMDRQNTPGVAVVNEAFVRKFFKKGKALEERLAFANEGFKPGSPGFIIAYRTVGEVEIVGVVRDVKYESRSTEPEAALYIPHEQFIMRRMSLVFRTAAASPQGVLQQIRSEVASAAPSQAVEFELYPQIVGASLARERLGMMLLVVFGIVALVLAGVGIYGVISYSVTQRTAR